MKHQQEKTNLGKEAGQQLQGENPAVGSLADCNAHDTMDTENTHSSAYSKSMDSATNDDKSDGDTLTAKAGSQCQK